ncbi:MAG: hypothetical protein AB8F34_00195 [Akkermansiaceae bacterium]
MPIADVHSASIELKNGDTLSGKISAFTPETLTLASKVSYEPLQIDSNVIQSIVFDDNTKDVDVHGEKLTFSNGDTIPCKIISLDKENLKISTWFAGEFTVKRSQIRAIQFGVGEQQVIYNGKDELSDWTTREGSWSKLSDGTLSCRGSGVLARKFDLPTNLRIKYTLAWKGTPNFAFRFCGENKSATTKQNTYEYTFNNAGMQIRRYVGSSDSGAPLVNIPLKPTNFSGKNLKLDFHINRASGMVTLFVDGTKIGSWPDSFDQSTGNFIIFNNRSSKNTVTLKGIVISDMNDGALPRHRESIDKSKSDVFLDSTGDIYSGTILSLEKEGTKRVMKLKRDASSKPFKVPENKISSLSFSQAEDLPDFEDGDFDAIFESSGQIQLSNPKFTDGFVEATHPILGKLNVDIKAISQLKKHSAEK